MSPWHFSVYMDGVRSKNMDVQNEIEVFWRRKRLEITWIIVCR